ncbi:MAG: hypothetical protein AAF548_02490 [Actinomycetota bacterium]
MVRWRWKLAVPSVAAVFAVACGPAYDFTPTLVDAIGARHALLDNGEVIVRQSERDVGADLNGDGDETDGVAVVLAPDGSVRSTGLAGLHIAAAGGSLAFISVSEVSQGGVDLNGDGVLSTEVLYLYDGSTGLSSPLGRNGRGLAAVGDGTAMVVLTEGEAGLGDANGDADTDDRVLHRWSPTTGFATLGLATGSSPVDIAANGDVFVRVGEQGQGMTDLDGNGTIAGSVVHRVTPTDVATPMPHVTSVHPDRARAAISMLVSETSAGLDLDGDGQVGASVWHRWELTEAAPVNLGHPFALFDETPAGLLHGRVHEAAWGGDANGDGDTDDEVVAIYDPESEVLSSTGFAGWAVGLVDGRMALLVNECEQGETDLNGNGTGSFLVGSGPPPICDGELVLHILELATGAATNVGIAVAFDPAFGGPVALPSGGLAFQASESANGVDYSGDGALAQAVFFSWSPAYGLGNWRLGVSAGPLGVTPQGDVLVTRYEGGSAPGAIDWNDDGDTLDSFASLWSETEGFTLDAAPKMSIVVAVGDDGTVVYQYRETFEDLNGDGDRDDRFWSVARPGSDE